MSGVGSEGRVASGEGLLFRALVTNFWNGVLKAEARRLARAGFVFLKGKLATVL